MGLGLLGAIGGAGQAIQRSAGQFQQGITQKMLLQERDKWDKERLTLTQAFERGESKLTREATLEAATAGQEFTTSERLSGQEFTTSERGEKEQHAIDLAKATPVTDLDKSKTALNIQKAKDLRNKAKGGEGDNKKYYDKVVARAKESLDAAEANMNAVLESGATAASEEYGRAVSKRNVEQRRFRQLDDFVRAEFGMPAREGPAKKKTPPPSIKDYADTSIAGPPKPSDPLPSIAESAATPAATAAPGPLSEMQQKIQRGPQAPAPSGGLMNGGGGVTQQPTAATEGPIRKEVANAMEALKRWNPKDLRDMGDFAEEDIAEAIQRTKGRPKEPGPPIQSPLLSPEETALGTGTSFAPRGTITETTQELEIDPSLPDERSFSSGGLEVGASDIEKAQGRGDGLLGQRPLPADERRAFVLKYIEDALGAESEEYRKMQAATEAQIEVMFNKIHKDKTDKARAAFDAQTAATGARLDALQR